MSQPNDVIDGVRFEFGADVEKAWQDEKTGKMHVRAIASDDVLDVQRDRMSPAALKKMADFASKGVPFLETHRSTFEFGKTVSGQVVETKDKNGKSVRQFVVEVELDGDFPQARKLFKEVALGKCKRQLSIGGKLNLKNREAVSVEMTPNGLARTINDIELDHIASTREKHAANPRTSFTAAISKALDLAEEQGWKWEGVEKSKEPLAKADEKGQNTPQGGDPMAKKAPETMTETTTEAEKGKGCPATPGSSAESTPEKAGTTGTETTTEAEKAKAPASDTTTASPEQAKKTSKPKAEAIATDIAFLLSKGAEVDGDLYDALWATRYVLAKQAKGGEGAKMVEAGPYAPRDLSAASSGVQDDKAKGDAAVGGSGVTDHKRNIQAGGEIAVTTKTAKEAFALTMQKLRESGKLPQVGEGDNFGKEFTPEMLEKVVGDGFAVMLEKTVAVQKEMMIAAVEQLAEEQANGLGEVKKSVDSLGGLVNDATGRLAEIEARVGRVEKAGGVSHSGPRGASDAAAPASPRRGVWTGVFDKAASSALSTYR